MGNVALEGSLFSVAPVFIDSVGAIILRTAEIWQHLSL